MGSQRVSLDFEATFTFTHHKPIGYERLLELSNAFPYSTTSAASFSLVSESGLYGNTHICALMFSPVSLDIIPIS